MKKNRKGFTLIELLAVIVILGLLMAIAIPSVTRYITQSRRKTVVTSINSYVTSVLNQVNDGEYKFSDSTKIYAVPIECIPLEKGGTNPFGNWLQANEAYWAYVLVQYDNENYNYTYGFTFKDDAGYGMYPTSHANIDESGKQVKTGYDDLNKPNTGLAVEFVTEDKWNGFEVASTTQLVVLEAESEGISGNGETTCTLCQKGDNYEAIEQEKKMRLSNLIREHNTLITSAPTLTTSSNNTSDASGLYSSTATNSGNPTYYFRGNVTNNYVSFAGQTWRIVRINEDGTIRLIMQNGINSNTPYKFNYPINTYIDTYYSNSNIAKPQVDKWYQLNIVDKGYDNYVATTTFCEQAKVTYYKNGSTGSAKMEVYTSYTPDFKCNNDSNGKGIINSKVGLITYDEVVYAGGYFNEGDFSKENDKYYLHIYRPFWTMSPAGDKTVWDVLSNGTIYRDTNGVQFILLPIINLNANITATGTGTETDPYVVQTN